MPHNKNDFKQLLGMLKHLPGQHPQKTHAGNSGADNSSGITIAPIRPKTELAVKAHTKAVQDLTNMFEVMKIPMTVTKISGAEALAPVISGRITPEAGEMFVPVHLIAKLRSTFGFLPTNKLTPSGNPQFYRPHGKTGKDWISYTPPAQSPGGGGNQTRAVKVVFEGMDIMYKPYIEAE